MIQKSSERNQRGSKIVEADVICQKFRMWFELPNCNRVVNDDVMIMNRSQIVFESRCVNKGIEINYNTHTNMADHAQADRMLSDLPRRIWLLTVY